MDDRAWIREDTLTMQLAIPPDYTFTTSTYIMMNWYKITGATGWQKMRDRACTAQHCQIVPRVDLHGRAGDIHVQ